MEMIVLVFAVTLAYFTMAAAIALQVNFFNGVSHDHLQLEYRVRTHIRPLCRCDIIMQNTLSCMNAHPLQSKKPFSLTSPSHSNQFLYHISVFMVTFDLKLAVTLSGAVLFKDKQPMFMAVAIYTTQLQSQLLYRNRGLSLAYPFFVTCPLSGTLQCRR